MSIPPDSTTSTSITTTTLNDPSPSSSFSSSSTTSLKRSASDPDMDILIHKAKASRYAPPHHNDSDSYQELATCSICAEIYLDPVLVNPCHHSFCGSCAARWLETSCTCPACRGKVTSTSPNTTATALVEVILLQHPEKARPAEEIAELKLLYKPGQTISIYEDYPSEDEDESVDEEEEWTAANNADFVWHPCPACTEGGEFTCLAPITPSIDGHHVFSSWYQGHMKCTFCDRSVPTTWKPYRCDICSDVSCGNMFPCANKPDSEGWIAAVEDQTFGFPPNQRRWGTLNPTEQERMLKYIAEAGLSWEAIGQQLVTNILLPEGAVRSGQNICKGCASGHFETSLMKWWIWYQEEFRVESERENCWYGYTCRTQTHRPDHAARLNHACNPIPQDQTRRPNRREGAPTDLGHIVRGQREIRQLRAGDQLPLGLYSDLTPTGSPVPDTITFGSTAPETECLVPRVPSDTAGDTIARGERGPAEE